MKLLESRLCLWGLASMSFACLLGHFYGWWPMPVFAICVLLPATLLLALTAVRGKSETRFIIVQGALAGLFAAVIYDLFRVPFVLAGKPLFAVFPQFGQLLLFGQLNGDTSFWPQLAGWTYHFSHGAARGLMGAAMVPLCASPQTR
ncbi:MAG: hypothetical protein KY445_17415, partial [Armatimonadetes bacterium]|nr:hypothetical protein [Armatimonadota bacterium]